ncbi:MAG: HD-GYP domain-containing protein [Gammaproteobacteria bacterium]|nr:HD-GYP domain-containing protein [Gammaproteobacteria bacterium]
MKIKKEINELSLGMHVCDLDRPWVESSFLFQGFEITTESEIQKLRKECKFVYIDTEKSVAHLHPLQSNVSSEKYNQGLEFVDTIIMNINDIYDDSFEQDLEKAKIIHNSTQIYIEGAFNVLRNGGDLDIESAKDAVSDLIEHIMNNPDALLWLSQLKEKDEYTAVHSVNVCILSLVFGRELGLTESELNILGLGALLFDIGKSRISDEVLKKSDSLSQNEFLLMKAHSYLGFAMLDENKNIAKEVLDIVLNHHERLNGIGYPNSRKGDEISRFTRIVSIVDAFDAMTSDRCYKDAFQAQHALNELYNMAPSELDQELIEAFIKCIGIYPVGSIVELNTGHTGVVVKLNEKNKLKPLVGLVLNRKHEPYENIKFLNLSSNVWQKSSGDKVEIKKILEPHAFKIDVRSVIKKITQS